MRTRGAHPLVAKRKIDMNLDRAIFTFAGTMILASLALGHFVSPWWHLLTAFVGLKLLQSSFTGFCPSVRLFARLGLCSGREIGRAPCRESLCHRVSISGLSSKFKITN